MPIKFSKEEKKLLFAGAKRSFASEKQVQEVKAAGRYNKLEDIT